jgi:hypothetical protein
MKFFKLRFIPTGTFYKPSLGYVKNNLSKSGKTYMKKAISFAGVNRIAILEHLLPDRPDVRRDPRSYQRWKVIETAPEDWEWVEYEVIEKETSKINHGS